MATATLIACKGARYVEREELERVEPPAATETWVPTKHSVVVDTVIEAIQQSGFELEEQRHSLSRGNARYFGTLRLSALLVPGVRLAVGIRNSVDKSLPMGFVAGNQVLACQNLMFRSDLMGEVRRKHSKNGMRDFVRHITTAVGQLEHFQKAETKRLEFFQRREITDTQAESIMLRGYERGIVSARHLPELIENWRNPPYPEFEDRTLFSLENAFTGVLTTHVQKANPTRFCALTFALQGLLSEAAGIRPAETCAQAAA